jgi:hypothetical protein
VHKGVRYRAVIALNFWEQVASNDAIKEKLVEVGFTDVQVTGSGHVRNAEATWPLADATAQVPPQVISVRQIETQIASR